jgi:hypothetical protein
MDYYIKYEQPNNTCSRERINVGRMAHNYIVLWGEFLSFLLAFWGVYYRGYASPKTALFFNDNFDNFGRLYQLYADLWVERGCNMIFGD